MARNPYAAPKVAVETDARPTPNEWQRAKWLFGGLWVALTLLPALNALLQPRPSPDGLVLAVNCSLAAAVGGFVARDMWRLKERRSPLWVDIGIYVLVFGGLALLIAFKETGMLVWNDLHLDIPVSLLMGIIAAAAWITEAKKKVRVYVTARSMAYVDAK